MSASLFVANLPQPVNPTEDSRKSRAPYNFVPLPERVVRAVEEAKDLPWHDRYDRTDYPRSGCFKVRLTTETPLYIRARVQPVERASAPYTILSGLTCMAWQARRPERG